MLARLDPTYADKPLNTAHEFARALYLWKAAISEFRNDALKFTGSVIADAFSPQNRLRQNRITNLCPFFPPPHGAYSWHTCSTVASPTLQ